MKQLDIVERLRGKVRVPVNDGAGLLNGLDYFERTFPTSKAAMEAAAEIETLRTQLARAREALKFYADPFAWKKANDPGDDIRVPDFYNETSFGDEAKVALADD